MEILEPGWILAIGAFGGFEERIGKNAQGQARDADLQIDSS